MTSSASTSAASAAKTPTRTRHPTCVEVTNTHLREAAQAKWWRKSIARLSLSQLSRLIGYSINSIAQFERGYRYDGHPLTPSAWRKYRLTCAGLCNLSWGAKPWESYLCPDVDKLEKVE